MRGTMQLNNIAISLFTLGFSADVSEVSKSKMNITGRTAGMFYLCARNCNDGYFSCPPFTASAHDMKTCGLLRRKCTRKSPLRRHV